MTDVVSALRRALEEGDVARAVAVARAELATPAPDLESLVTMADDLTGYGNEQRPGASEDLYEIAVELVRRARGERHVDTWSALAQLELFYKRNGQTAQVERIARTLVDIAGQLGDEKLRVVSLLRLADSLVSEGKDQEAERIYLFAVEVEERRAGKQSLDLDEIIAPFQALLERQGRLDEAASWLTRKIGITSRRRGANSLDKAAALRNLATLFQRQKKYERAAQLAEQSLALFERGAGKEHLYAAWALRRLAEIEHEMGRLSRARDHAIRALAILERERGADDREAVELRQWVERLSPESRSS